MADEKIVKSKSGKLMKILLIFLLVIIIAMGAFVGYWFFIRKPKTANTKVDVVTPTAREIRLADEKTFEMEDFVVNLADPNTKSYLKVKIFLGYTEKDAKFLEELNNKKPQIRDAVLTDLRSKASKDFDNKGVEKLKKELLERINDLLIKGQVTNVYVNDLLIQ